MAGRTKQTSKKSAGKATPAAPTKKKATKKKAAKKKSAKKKSAKKAAKKAPARKGPVETPVQQQAGSGWSVSDPETQDAVWEAYADLGSIRSVWQHTAIPRNVVERVVANDPKRRQQLRDQLQEQQISEAERVADELRRQAFDVAGIQAGNIHEIKTAAEERRMTHIIDKNGEPLPVQDAAMMLVNSRYLSQIGDFLKKVHDMRMNYQMQQAGDGQRQPGGQERGDRSGPPESWDATEQLEAFAEMPDEMLEGFGEMFRRRVELVRRQKAEKQRVQEGRDGVPNDPEKPEGSPGA